MKTKFLAGLAGIGAVFCGCRSVPPIPPNDPELIHLAQAGQRALDHGTPDGATRLFAQALDRARALDQPATTARLANSLAVSRWAAGDFGGAEQALAEAFFERARAGERDTTEQLLAIRLALRRGAAAEAAARAERLAAAKALSRADRRDARELLAAARLATEGPAAARAALPPEAGHDQPAAAAESRALRARIAAAEENWREAAAAYESAAAAAGRAGRRAAPAPWLDAAAAAWRAADALENAAAAGYRAARARLALGQTAAARAALARARDDLARRADNPTLARLLDDLEQAIVAVEHDQAPAANAAAREDDDAHDANEN